jgi:tetratricopeptide (TPR) repeat protein
VVTLLPVSNLFSVLIIAERTLLVPSVGAMLLVGTVASIAFARSESTNRRGLVRFAFAAGTAVFGIVGLVRSRNRQHVWRDDQTLFARTVVDAPASYRAQFFYGQWLFESGQRSEGEKHLRLAIQLNPTPSDVSPLNYLATQYRDAGMCGAALPLYERAIANDSTRPDVRYGLASCLLTAGRLADGKRLAADGVRRGDLKGLFEELIARADSETASHH